MSSITDGIYKNANNYTGYYGRRVLTTTLTESELTPNNVKAILEEQLPNHFKNAKEIDYLIKYREGMQDIINKEKLVRPEINNIVVENNAYHIVEFKKGYVFGDPIQYVQRGSTENTEIDKLNTFMLDNDKPSRDKELAEDFYTSGNAYRMIFPKNDEVIPFEIFESDPRQTGVIYSADYENKPILAFYIALKKDYKEDVYNYILTVYSKKKVFKYISTAFATKPSEYQAMTLEWTGSANNYLGEIPIVEYPLNKSRLGLIELVKSILDTLNKISSNDIDAIEQYVQSLLVLYNIDIDSDEFKKMVAAGAILAKNNAERGQEAKVDMLKNELTHSETKILFDRLYNNMLTIVGIPRMTDKASSGDTGQARLIGEGWSMADQKAKQDELSFKLAEKQMLRIALKICKGKANSGIKNLTVNDIDIKFTRNKSDNMLVKAETLQLLKACEVSPDVAFEACQLFSDSSDVVKKSQEFYGGDFWKVADKSSDVNSDKNTKVVVDTPKE